MCYRSNRLAVLLVVAALLGSCRDSTAPSAAGVTEEGATFRAEASRSSFSGTEEVWVFFILENPRDTAITLEYSSDCEVSIFILKPDGEQLFPGFFSCNLEMAHTVVLGPGAADTVPITLSNPARAGNNTIIPLTAGYYTFFAEVGPLGDANRSTESNRVRVRYSP